MKTQTVTTQFIDSSELDRIVTNTYGRHYCFQQQDGCKSRGIMHVQVPTDGYDYPNNTVPEVVNHQERGVSFAGWLARDPKQPLPHRDDSFGLELWWNRNFYPHLDMILNDLHARGIINAGNYCIEIDW